MRSPAPPSAARYLAARTRLGIKFGLETIRALVEALGHPERGYETVLVAGTNGKGSVAAYLDAALREAGLKVGLYTSPHLVRLNERIAVDGREISDARLDASVGRVREAARALLGAGRIEAHPTYFEAVTAAAFDHFRNEGVEVAVLEVGMGGRLDATNIVSPLASAIVSIARDHEAYLGNTLEAIALEKAGVLRRDRPTVLGPLPRAVRRVVARRAAAVGARLVDARAGVKLQSRNGDLRIRTPRRAYRGVRPLPGAYQRDNVLVAVRLLEELRAAGLAFDLDKIPAGIARTRWPGRLEWVPGDPPLLLDGAHNPAAAQALARHLRSLGPFVLLFGAMADKDVTEMGRILFPKAEAVVLTQPPGSRAARPEEIVARVGSPASRAHRQADPRRALDLARGLATWKRPVVVAGSLYLVGRVKEVLARERSRQRGGRPSRRRK